MLVEYRRLVDVALPERARTARWVVRADHCFGRILLDHATGGCWYDVLSRSRAAGPAYRQLTDEQLGEAVAMAHSIEQQGDPLLRSLNDQSLRWRGKPTRSSRAVHGEGTDAPAA